MIDINTLTIVFLMGLLGGVHCLGMCGGVVALLTSALPAELMLKKHPYITLITTRVGSLVIS
jgi:sulfite exporter TauE/SafE